MGTGTKRTSKKPVPTIRQEDVVRVLDLMSHSVVALRAVMTAMGGPKKILVQGTKRRVRGTERDFPLIPRPVLSPICKDDTPWEDTTKKAGPR